MRLFAMYFRSILPTEGQHHHANDFTRTRQVNFPGTWVVIRLPWCLWPFHPWRAFYQNGPTLIPAWISNHVLSKVWDELFIHSQAATMQASKIGKDKYFHRAFYDGCNYLYMLGFKLIRNSKRGPWFLCSCTEWYGIDQSTPAKSQQGTNSLFCLPLQFHPNSWYKQCYLRSLKYDNMLLASLSMFNDTLSYICCKYMKHTRYNFNDN